MMKKNQNKAPIYTAQIPKPQCCEGKDDWYIEMNNEKIIIQCNWCGKINVINTSATLIKTSVSLIEKNVKQGEIVEH